MRLVAIFALLLLIARALTQEPKLLVMDEPTANLDFGNQLLVHDRIGALARQGMASRPHA